MKHHHCASNARHARMFELLRQSQLAEITTARLARPRAVEPGMQDMVLAMRENAIRSLRGDAPPPHRASPSPFRSRPSAG